MINISENGNYYSAEAKKVLPDNGVPFYTDDWVWDTYLAVHPLRILLEPQMQQHILQSYLRVAEQTPEHWLPTFPEVTGDTHRMNGNHAISLLLMPMLKGYRELISIRPIAMHLKLCRKRVCSLDPYA